MGATWLAPQALGRTIEGFSSTVSIAPTQRLFLHVSTSPGASYRVEVYRLGWYDGTGARLLECIPSCAASELGRPRSIPAPDPETGEIRAGWPVTDRVTGTRGWPSGYYIAELELTSGPGAGTAATVPFVVRATAADPAPILVVAPVNTWQAYNTWGGKSLYVNLIGPNRKDYARAVSFDRPYDSAQSRTLLYWEYPLARFLERNGYDVAYTTDVDVDRDPAQLERYALVIVPGHSEYWTKTTRDALENARDSGTNLAFIGGNDGYWQARYADNRRTLLEYRDSAFDPDPDAATKTIRFRDLNPPRPECSLVGLEWQNGWESDSVAQDYTVNAAALDQRWFAGTGFVVGSVLSRIVGYEWDAVEPDCPNVPELTVFFQYEGTLAPATRSPFDRSYYSTNANVVAYTAPSGARVFSTGSIQFSWGLDGFAQTLATTDPNLTDQMPPDPRLQRFMRNVFDDLSHRNLDASKSRFAETRAR